MIQTLQTRRPPRLLAWALAALMAGPLLVGLTGCGHGGSGGTDQTTTAPPANTGGPAPMADTSGANGTNATAPPKPGMSTGKKVVIALAGAALLYYLYKKHQAAQQAQGGQAAGQSQLYRSANGGVYYRDAQHRAVWLSVPNQAVQVPQEDIQRYAPDYQQYQGQPAPSAPAGAPQQSFNQYDPSLAGSGG